MQQKLNLKARVSSRNEAEAYLADACDAVIVERGRPRWLIVVCPCGCGAHIPVNLDARAGPAWRMYVGKRGLSLYPSVWRDSDCESHFIILRDNVYSLGYREEGGWWLLETAQDDATIEAAVLKELSQSAAVSYEEIAGKIPDTIPWDVLRACRRLARRGIAEEPELGSFRLNPRYIPEAGKA